MFDFGITSHKKEGKYDHFTFGSGEALHLSSEGRLAVQVEVMDGVKCPRCWKYHGVRENFDDLCDRCCLVIVECYPDNEAVPFIKESFRKQKEKYSTPPKE